MKKPFSKAFLFEYFSGSASSLHKRMIDDWVKDPRNEELFFRYLEEWERLHAYHEIDINQGIQEFRTKISDNKDKAPADSDLKPEIIRRGTSRSVWFSAASFLLLCGLGWIFRETLLYGSYHSLPGEIKSYTLPDSSIVTLNANSSIKVPRLWNINPERSVFLSGEAEFHVRKDSGGRKFTVRTGNNVDIVVLGTIFTVFNRDQRTRVALNEGKVELRQQFGNTTKTIGMIPGDKVVFEKGLPVIHETGQTVAQVPLWKENRFEFEKTGLKDIKQLISDYYALKAEFGEAELESLTISGSFVALNAEEFLESVCLMNGLSYKQSGDTVTFFREHN